MMVEIIHRWDSAIIAGKVRIVLGSEGSGNPIFAEIQSRCSKRPRWIPIVDPGIERRVLLEGFVLMSKGCSR